jgi:hypothetical protein
MLTIAAQLPLVPSIHVPGVWIFTFGLVVLFRLRITSCIRGLNPLLQFISGTLSLYGRLRSVAHD